MTHTNDFLKWHTWLPKSTWNSNRLLLWWIHIKVKVVTCRLVDKAKIILMLNTLWNNEYEIMQTIILLFIYVSSWIWFYILSDTVTFHFRHIPFWNSFAVLYHRFGRIHCLDLVHRTFSSMKLVPILTARVTWNFSAKMDLQIVLCLDYFWASWFYSQIRKRETTTS